MTKNNKTIILHPSWLNYSGNFLLGIILLIIGLVCFIKEFSIQGYEILDYLGYILILAAIIILLNAALKRFSRTYTITYDAVRLRIGILSRNEKEIRIDDIREIGIKQGILQRIFRLGNISFSSASTSGVEVVFEGVRNPMSIKEQVNKIRNK